jgi:8-hydroxy-5-deazaflavin:NADPH oxidoreductase
MNFEKGKRKIAIVGGTGDQGSGLALRLLKAGENVIIGSRQEEKAKDSAAKLKEILGTDISVEGFSNEQAAANGDVVILAVPFGAHMNIVKSIKDGLREGSILVDACVPLESEIGGKATRTVAVWDGSAAEQAAKNVPKGVMTVAAFNNVSAEILQDLDVDVDCDVLVCGRDVEAKKVIMEIAEEIPKVRAIDAGPLENARTVEQITPLLIGLNIRHKCRGSGIRITGIRKVP